MEDRKIEALRAEHHHELARLINEFKIKQEDIVTMVLNAQNYLVVFYYK